MNSGDTAAPAVYTWTAWWRTSSDYLFTVWIQYKVSRPRVKTSRLQNRQKEIETERKQRHWDFLLRKEGKVNNDVLHFVNDHCNPCTCLLLLSSICQIQIPLQIYEIRWITCVISKNVQPCLSRGSLLNLTSKLKSQGHRRLCHTQQLFVIWSGKGSSREITLQQSSITGYTFSLIELIWCMNWIKIIAEVRLLLKSHTDSLSPLNWFNTELWYYAILYYEWHHRQKLCNLITLYYNHPNAREPTKRLQLWGSRPLTDTVSVSSWPVLPAGGCIFYCTALLTF